MQQSQNLKYCHLISTLNVYKKLNFVKWNTLIANYKNTKTLKNVKSQKTFTLSKNKMKNVILNIKSQNTMHGDFGTLPDT